MRDLCRVFVEVAFSGVISQFHRGNGTEKNIMVTVNSLSTCLKILF